uniref:FBA_2 domain-containing protein n=1 Tax=Caenorhabditis tropicalis TaxID=1561998 RepID=A0A1I7U2L7_9PELO
MEFSSFLILDLPFVPPKEVALCWNPFEIMNAYNTSKRMRNAIKSMSLKNKYKSVIHLSSLPKIILQGGGMGYSYLLERKHLNEDYQLPDSCPLNEEAINKMKIFFNDLVKVFGCRIQVVSLEEYNLCIGCVRLLMNWLISLQTSIGVLRIESIMENSNEIFYLTQKLKIKKGLFFRHFISLSSWESFPMKFDVDFLQINKIDFKSWFPIDTIIASNCIIFDLGNFWFSVEDMNRFIKSWIQGSNSRMKYFRVNIGFMDHQRLIDGIKVFENNESLRRSFTHQYDIPQLLDRFEFQGGSDIQSISGRRATFQQYPRVFHDENGQVLERIVRRFQMVVWDD